MTHKFNEAEYEARMQAKAKLGKVHTPPHTVPGLVARVDLIDMVIGVTQ